MPHETVEGTHYFINGEFYPIPVYKKYLGNMRNGFRQIAGNSLVEFSGYPDMENHISLRGFFSEESISALQERVVDPVKQLAAKYGVHIYPTDISVPHLSLADLGYLPETPGDREDVFRRLIQDKTIIDMTQKLIPLPLPFDTLFGSKAAIALAVSRIPADIASVREQMTHVAQAYQMDMKNVTNIAHITVARWGNNTENPPERLGFFARDLLHLHHEVVKDPLILVMDRMELMSNQEFTTKHEQRLFDQLVFLQNK